MLTWAQIAELHGAGHEIGGHSHSHPQLDLLPAGLARGEIVRCKDILEDRLGQRIRGFAYPHGYSSPRVRRLVYGAGYENASAVRNTLSTAADDRFAVSRLTLTNRTALAEVRAWLEAGEMTVGHLGSGVLLPVGWRTCRRARRRVLGRERTWDTVHLSR